MKVWRKQTTRNGGRTTIYSKRFYGTLRTADGKRKQVPLSEDRETSVQLLQRLQLDEDRQRALGVDRYARERQRPIDEHVHAYELYLRSKANTERHVTLTLRRLRLLLTATKTKTVTDVDALRIASTLSAWRSRKRKPLSLSTSNHYAQAIRGFSRWLYVERKMQEDTLRGLRPLNADVDRKRIRRALTLDELRQLIHATETSGKTMRGETWKFTPADRAILYTLAAFTGLRASELASLTESSFDFQAMTVSVQAAYSKRRRNDTLPLHPMLVERLRPWITSKRGVSDGLLFPGTWTNYKAAKLLRGDLKRAGIAYVDASGRYADFHSLRHTFITQLARHGVHPAKAKELARHTESLKANRAQLAELSESVVERQRLAAAAAQQARDAEQANRLAADRLTEAAHERQLAEKRAFNMSVVAASAIGALSVLAFEGCVHLIPWSWMKNHTNALPLQVGISALIVLGCQGAFVPRWRKWRWEAALLPFFVALLKLLGGSGGR